MSGEVMLKQFALAVCAVTLTGGLVAAQASAPQTPAKEQPAEKSSTASKPSEPPPLVNIRLDLTILDQSGPGEPSKKVVTMVVADRQTASIRTSGFVFTKEGRRDVNINVDARPTLVRGKEG